MACDGKSIVGPVANKIAWAEARMRDQGEFLHGDRQIADLLERLRVAIRRSHKAMLDAEVVGRCAQCELEEGGSCCGDGLENRYDGVMLLINLLLGAELPHEETDGRSCFFLGANGCRLRARDVICVNYLCHRITDHSDGQKLDEMREHEGVQLEILFHLHARISKMIRETGDG